jgi:transcriptional regulator with XRE-family HTH domain
MQLAKRIHIGHHVRRLRMEQKLTLHQLAEMTSLSAPYLSQIENDKASPSITSLQQIARALKARIVDFFTDELVDDPPIMPPPGGRA